MKAKKIFTALFATTFLMLFCACNQPEKQVETPPTASDLDFTYTTQSEEALKQFKEGQTIFELGDRERAQAYFDKAIELDSDFAMAYLFRAWARTSPQEYDKYTKLVNEKNKNLSEAEQLMIELNNAYATSDVTKRLAIGKTMVEKFPEIARAHVTLGNAYEDMNDYTNARKSYEKVIELRPDWIAGYRLLGGSYLSDQPKDLTKAEENMKKMVELMPNESRTHIALGDVYRTQQSLEKAIVSYKKAAELAPKDEQVYAKAGHANLLLGNYDQARKEYEKSGTMGSAPEEYLENIAYTYLYEGKHAEGMTYLKEKMSTLDNAGLSADELMNAKISMLNKCIWITNHLGDAAEMKALLAQIQPLDLERVNSMATAELMMRYKARKNNREGMLAVLEGKLDVAKEKAAAEKAELATINNPNKLEYYYILMGDIAMKEGKYDDAIANLEKAITDGSIYPKYKLAMANKKAGNEEKANQLFQEILDVQWINLPSALVRNEVKSMYPQRS